MTTTTIHTQQILNTFDSLETEEQLEIVSLILKRVIHLELPAISKRFASRRAHPE